MRRRRILVATTIAVWLSACTPYVYDKEITAFGSGVNKVSEAFASGRAALASDRAELARADWVRQRTHVAAAESCDAFERPEKEGTDGALPPCGIAPVADDGSVTLPRLPPATQQLETQLKDANVIFEALDGYAERLVAITRAADRAELDKQIGAFNDSIKKLVEAGKEFEPGLPTLGEQFDSLTGLAGTAVGAYLDARRYAVLRNGVTEAQPAIDVLGPAAGTILEELRRERLDQRRAILRNLARRLNPSLPDQATTSDAYAPRLAAYEAEFRVFSALRDTDPLELGEDLVKAHEELKTALQDPNYQIEPLLKALGEFIRKAQAVEKAFAADAAAPG